MAVAAASGRQGSDLAGGAVEPQDARLSLAQDVRPGGGGSCTTFQAIAYPDSASNGLRPVAA
ncbi:hypothetical protein [Streptomyces sp. NBC_00239]|uniref:hypothetical protein n=1 Tax=Streptomyces sp. NBC_00239 TaxID=2903640 RepID=UPI002E2860CE|nr:hypothetical protein [Streptomyces sp. NBC_00239]